MADAYSKDDMDRRMKGAIATFKSELGGLRTGRASPALLDPVKVEAYGNMVPVSQVGSISTPEARMITVQVWDKGLAKAVDKAIRDAGLGLNPQMDGQLLRIPLWGTVGGRYGLIAVDRDGGASAFRAMLTEARRRIADGRPLVIFPEGTRVPHGTRVPLQAGFAGLYKMLGLPVIPVAVDSGALYQRRWKRGGTIRFLYGAEIPPGLPREEIEARVLAAINALNP
jgi:hypothetical protein